MTSKKRQQETITGRVMGSFVFKDRGELSIFEDRSKEFLKPVEKKLTETCWMQNGLNVRGDRIQHLANRGHQEKVPPPPGRMGLTRFTSRWGQEEVWGAPAL